MGGNSSKSIIKYTQDNPVIRDNDTPEYSKLPNATGTGTNSNIASTVDGLENERDSGRDTERESASSKTHRAGPRYNTKTGTFTFRKRKCRPRTPLKHIFRDKTSVSQDAEIESMVNKYRTKIMKDVTVRHILFWMKTFIDVDGIDEIAEKDSNAAAMEKLLYKIQNCKKKGRWQRFVDALQANSYHYECNLLRGGPKKKGRAGQEKLLNILAPGIIDRINPVEIAFYLRCHDAINSFDLEEIKQAEQTTGKRSAASKLLNIIPRGRSADWFHLLCDALRKEGQDDLANLFLVRYEDVSSNTEEPCSSSSSESETTSEPRTLESDFRLQRPKRRLKRHLRRRRSNPSKLTYRKIRDLDQETLVEEIAGFRRESNRIEEKGQVLRELRRKEENLKIEYGERPDFEFDLSELRRKLTVLDEKEQLMEKLKKKEHDFKIKFGKGVENTEDNSELKMKLDVLKRKKFLMEQIETCAVESTNL